MSATIRDRRRAQFRLLYLVCGPPGLHDIRQLLNYTSRDPEVVRAALNELSQAGMFQVRGPSIHPTRKGQALAEELGLSRDEISEISRANTQQRTENPLEYIPSEFRRGEDEWFGS